MTDEVWKPVVGYEGLYEISTHNQVARLERAVKMPRYTRIVPRKLLVITLQNNTYLRVNLTKDGMIKSVYVHKLVEAAFGIQFVSSKTYAPTATRRKDAGIKNLLSAWRG
jgi:hypothetical protein